MGGVIAGGRAWPLRSSWRGRRQAGAPLVHLLCVCAGGGRGRDGCSPPGLAWSLKAAAQARMPFSPSALSERLRCRRRALPRAADKMRSAASASSSAGGATTNHRSALVEWQRRATQRVQEALGAAPGSKTGGNPGPPWPAAVPHVCTGLPSRADSLAEAPTAVSRGALPAAQGCIGAGAAEQEQQGRRSRAGAPRPSTPPPPQPHLAGPR